MYQQLKENMFAVVWRHCDKKSVLRVVEVLNVDSESSEFSGWFYVHCGSVAAGQYVHERPLSERRLIPEWVHNTTGMVIVNPRPQQQQNCTKVLDDFSATNCEVIAHNFHRLSGGKVPGEVCRKADAWLRKQKGAEPRVVLALSNPTDQERAEGNRLR